MDLVKQAQCLQTFLFGVSDSTKTAKLVLFDVLPDAVDSGFGEDETERSPADVVLLSDAVPYAGTCNDG